MKPEEEKNEQIEQELQEEELDQDAGGNPASIEGKQNYGKVVHTLKKYK